MTRIFTTITQIKSGFKTIVCRMAAFCFVLNMPVWITYYSYCNERHVKSTRKVPCWCLVTKSRYLFISWMNSLAFRVGVTEFRWSISLTSTFKIYWADKASRPCWIISGSPTDFRCIGIFHITPMFDRYCRRWATQHQPNLNWFMCNIWTSSGLNCAKIAAYTKNYQLVVLHFCSKHKTWLTHWDLNTSIYIGLSLVLIMADVLF